MRGFVMLSAAMALLAAASACGGHDEPPPATFEVFTIQLLEVAEGDKVTPGQPLKYEVHYKGDLARNLRVRAVFTHEETGLSDSFSWPLGDGDSFREDLKSQWFLKHDFLKRPGRIRIHLEASITATRTGSEPWVTQSQWVYSELYPTLDSLELLSHPSGGEVPYGTTLEFRVTGKDLWDDVIVQVVDPVSGTPLPDVELKLPFDGTQTSVTATWTINAPALEHVGTHPLQLVARFGELRLASSTISCVVTHTVDWIQVLTLNSAGTEWTAGTSKARLQEVSRIGLRISGTQLAGHELSINGDAPMVAPADQFDVELTTPEADDFENGSGFRTYDFEVASGGMRRVASVTLQRWGITGCEWRTTDGRTLSNGETVARGTELVLYADVWGFPDTEGFLFFKYPLAEVTIWENDPGGRPTEPLHDITVNNDDEGDSFDAEIIGSAVDARWTAEYQDEVDVLDLHLNAAEYDFDIRIEDQLCTSAQEILVY